MLIKILDCLNLLDIDRNLLNNKFLNNINIFNSTIEN